MNHKYCGWVLPLVIILAAIFNWSSWIIIVAGALMILREFKHCSSCEMPKAKPVAKKKVARKKK